MFFLTALPALATAAVYGFIQHFPGLALYGAVSMIYEALRTFPRIYNSHWTRDSFCNGYAGPDVPLLFTEKIAASLFCALQGLYAAPVHMIEDVKRMELRLRGLDPLRFGYTEKDVNSSNSYASYLSIVFDTPSHADTLDTRRSSEEKSGDKDN